MRPLRRPSRSLPCGFVAALVLLAAAGCAPPRESPPAAAAGDGGHPEHGHEAHAHHDHDHPETLAAGVAELRSSVSKLEEALASDSPDAADEVVHAVGHLLEDLRGLIAGSALAAEGRAAASSALDELDECFGAIDEAFHAGESAAEPPAKVHAGMAERIAGALRKLEELP